MESVSGFSPDGPWAAGRYEPGRPKTVAASLILALLGLVVAGTAWSFGAFRIPLVDIPPAYLSPRLGLVGVVLALIGLWRVRRLRRAMVAAGVLAVVLNVGAVGLEVAASRMIPSTVTVRGEVGAQDIPIQGSVVFRGPGGHLLAATKLEPQCISVLGSGWCKASYSLPLPGRQAYVVEVDELGSRKIAYGDLVRHGFQYDIDFGAPSTWFDLW